MSPPRGFKVQVPRSTQRAIWVTSVVILSLAFFGLLVYLKGG